MKRKFLSVGLIISMLLVLLPSMAIASSETDLINKLKKSTSEDITQMYYDDFNGDGIYEMFALTGQFSGDAWFVSENQTKKLNNSHFNAATGETKSYIITENGKKYFEFFEVYGNGQTNSIVCTLQNNGVVKEVKFSGYLSHNQYGWCVSNSTYDSTIEKSDFNSGNYYGMVRTWKNYWYYIDETTGEFKEYGGTQITKEQFRSFKGSEDILNLITEGQIYNILYRDNGIININIINESGIFADNDAYACSNILVAYNDNSVWTIDDQHSDAPDDYRSPIYSGFYLPALNEDIAVYPDFKKNNTIKVILNGTELSFDQPPIMENDRVMVPIRAIFEALGYGLEWNQDTQTAIATKGNNKLSVPEGLSGLYVDDEWLSFDVPNINISGRILVPVRVVAQCAGAEVEWDGENQSVLIDYDSIIADKRVSILKYALFCDNHIKNIFTTEKYTYQTFYQDMYIDNIYSGIAVDLVAEYLVDEAADKDKYIDVITTLLNMADFTIEDNIEKQHEFDTYKTFGEYAWDVGEIMIGTISPEGNKKLEVIKSLIDADSEAINITIDSIEKYERLNKIQLETEYKMTILDILEEGSIDDNLTAACQEIRDAEKKKVLLELDILNESLTDVSEYLANDVLFKQMAFPLMKQSDAYANDETLKLIVDKGDDLYKKADDCLGALKTGFKLGLFAGDMILGTTDTINRVTEMKALAIIRLSFGSNLASQLANPLDSSKDVDEAYEELINIIPLIKFVDNIHLRGEYCMYKLMSEDQQLFSLIYDLSGDNLEKLNKLWDNTKSDLIWYDHKLSSICQ